MSEYPTIDGKPMGPGMKEAWDQFMEKHKGEPMYENVKKETAAFFKLNEEEQTQEVAQEMMLRLHFGISKAVLLKEVQKKLFDRVNNLTAWLNHPLQISITHEAFSVRLRQFRNAITELDKDLRLFDLAAHDLSYGVKLRLFSDGLTKSEESTGKEG